MFEEFQSSPVLLSAALILFVVSLQGLLLAFFLWRAERRLRVMSQRFHLALVRIEPVIRVVQDSLGRIENGLSSFGTLEDSIRKNSRLVVEMAERINSQAEEGLARGKTLLGGMDRTLDQGFRLYSYQLERLQDALASPLQNISLLLKNATFSVRQFLSGDRTGDKSRLTREPGEEDFV